MKKVQAVYLILCLLLLLLPLAGMAVCPTMETTENKTLSEPPSLTEDGAVNADYLADWGAYFSDHFAFRQQMVHANALLYGKLFGVSTTDEVVIGTDGWLYYSGTVGDYTAQSVMTDRALYNAVHNLTLMQGYVESRGSQFLLAIVPNKNTLYGEQMPYYYPKGQTPNNYERLMQLLQEAGIHYVDLRTEFEAQDEVLYFRQDSHWTNKGAALAYEAVMRDAGLAYERYDAVPYTVEQEHLGDLISMLYPLSGELEENEIYQKEWSYVYVNDVTDNMDNWIQTWNQGQGGTLLMYRDSFGEAWVPFFADAFGNAFFSRLVPYNLAQVDSLQPDLTVLERVERRLTSLIESAAVMQPPEVPSSDAAEMETETTLRVRADGGYYVVSGILDGACALEDCDIYLSVAAEGAEPVWYETFYVAQNTDSGINDYGYMVYLEQASVPAGTAEFQVIVHNASGDTSVAAQTVDLSSLS